MKRRTKLLLSRIPVWGSLFVALTMAVVVGTVLAQVDQLNLFQLDGDATYAEQSNSTPAADDWQNLANGGAHNSHLERFTGILPYAGTTFSTGGSKDTNDIGSWKWNKGSTPPKDQLTNAYAAAYTDPSSGDSIIYFGADRFANNGSAQIGFWFFQDSVTTNTNGTFHGVHTDGDFLVLANFTTGGTVVDIAVYKWENGSPVLQSGQTSQCGSGSVTNACAISNQGPVQLYWPYTAKFPTSGGSGESACANTTNCAPAASFFEGGIDLTSLFNGTTAPCISSYLVETRSSTSITAQLESFDLGSFELCSAAFNKTCPSGSLDANGETFDYSYGGTVTNTGHGTLYNATVTDTFPANATDITSDGTDPASNCTGGGTSAVVCKFNIGTLGPGECNTWPTPGTASTTCPTGGTGTFKSVTNGPQNSATAAASSSSSSTAPLTVIANVYGGTATTDTVSCPTTTGSPAVSANKTCSVTVDPADLSISVGYGGSICNQSPYSVSITGVTDAQNLPNGKFGTSTDVGNLTKSDGTTSVSLPYPLAPCPSGKTCDSTTYPNSCMLFGAPGTSDSYTPTQASNSDTATSACNINFSNTVTVTFTSPLFPLKTYTKTATEETPCALCSCSSSSSTQ